MSTHKAFTATAPGKYQVTEVPTPQPGSDQILVKVAYTVLIPLEVEVMDRALFGPDAYPYIPGFSVAGTVESIGECVNDLAVGDRVLGFPIPSYGNSAKGAQAYALLPGHAVSKIPSTLTLEDAATIPDNFVCAWWTLHNHLNLPLQPNKGPRTYTDESFLIYGASTTVGQFVLQILRLAGCTRVIAVASSSNHGLLRSLGASHTLDYHNADWPQQVLAANGGPVKYAIDIISTESSLRGLAAAVNTSSKVAIVLPIKLGQDKLVAQAGETGARIGWELPEEHNAFPGGLELELVRTFQWDEDETLKENLLTRYLPQLLAAGEIAPVPKRVIEEPSQSLSARVSAGLDLLRDNAVSGQKLVVKV
ncbi:GroES-like protein [Auricularia subglabra TFB-10046 SS5]|nr:GroES-like protein [Auricularia subglabra TFB-10046 SS5]